MSTPNESEPVLLQNDGSNFLSWSIHVLNAFSAISPLVERIVDASIPLPIVDWSNYKYIPKEEERCVQLNAQVINVILSILSAEVLDEVIFNGKHLRRVLISFVLDLSICMESPNVMRHMSLSQWITCPLNLHAVKRPHKTSSTPSRSKKCKSHMLCCLAAYTGRVRYC